MIERAEFHSSARNLAAYLAVRHRDLRDLQRALAPLGLSSLGRLEARVLPTLRAVRTALAALQGQVQPRQLTSQIFYAGDRRLAAQARSIFGISGPAQPVGLMVTCPSEAADDPTFMTELAKRGVQAVRINCAHDDVAAWGRMIGHLRAAEATLGVTLKVFMDLAGPKIRVGGVRTPRHEKKIHTSDVLAITRIGQLDRMDDEHVFAVECSLPEVLDVARIGDRVFVDDGKLAAAIERVEPWGVLARVTSVEAEGLKLKCERALNFPDTPLQVNALTDKDRKDLTFVTAHADGIEYSFVQSAEDVRMLQQALTEHRPDDWRKISLVLKIETARAVANLPEIIVQAAGRQPSAVMIARGDLAVEIGFARTAEMQEEILWIAEAASVPVIWATEVLEHLVKKGRPLRGEMTDAAMAARSECVMLNKGPYLFEAIDQLQPLLRRMNTNQHKKAPILRRLHSW
jgi:pyruvate kinase